VPHPRSARSRCWTATSFLCQRGAAAGKYYCSSLGPLTGPSHVIMRPPTSRRPILAYPVSKTCFFFLTKDQDLVEYPFVFCTRFAILQNLTKVLLSRAPCVVCYCQLQPLTSLGFCDSPRFTRLDSPCTANQICTCLIESYMSD
jgi:hypothetical protein